MKPEVSKWVDGLKRGDRLSLSRAITLIETGAPEHFEDRDQLVREMEPLSGNSLRLALTGVPGAGKSTLIDQLGMAWIEVGHKVAVLAVDPTSSLSQGSILGDKTRMTELSRHPSAFIRPSPTRLQLGGVASSTFETILLCEAAGFDRIIVETVGVGQSETLASTLTDVCLLLLLTGSGDDLQGVKKGILETADLVLVNKADGANEETARAFRRELQQIATLWPVRGDGKPARVLLGSSLRPELTQELVNQLETYAKTIRQNGHFQQGRDHQKIVWLRALIRKKLEENLQHNQRWKTALENAEAGIRNGLPVSGEAEKIWTELEGKDGIFSGSHPDHPNL